MLGTWSSIGIHLFFIAVAALNYAPYFMGFTLKVDNEYPEFLANLHSYQFFASQVASISACVPLLLDLFMDIILKQPSSIAIYLPRREIFFALMIPDIFIVAYIIPYEQFDLLPGLINVRDALFHYLMLSYMNHLAPLVFQKKWMIFASLLIASGNILASFSIVATDDSYFVITMWLTDISIAIVVVILSVTYFRWFQNLHRMISRKELLCVEDFICSIYTIPYAAFFITDWVSLLTPYITTNPDWNYLGVNYLTSYTYVMAFIIVVITVMSSKVAASEISAAKAMYTRYISHELRTPMHTIIMGLRVLHEELLSGCNAGCLDTITDIRKSADLAVVILDDLLMSNKIISKMMHLELMHLEPWQFVQESLQPMLVQARDKMLKVDITYKQSLQCILPRCSIHADPHKLGQVLRNVFSNALKFTPKGGSVDVTVEAVYLHTESRVSKCCHLPLFSYSHIAAEVDKEHCNFLRVTIKDTGVGISKENQEKLFDNILQFEPGKLQVGGGAGLGLFISKGIVTAHNGTISVQSDGEGAGCTFCIDIPMSLSSDPTKLYSVAEQAHSSDSEELKSDVSSHESEIESERGSGSAQVRDVGAETDCLDNAVHRYSVSGSCRMSAENVVVNTAILDAGTSVQRKRSSWSIPRRIEAMNRRLSFVKTEPAKALPEVVSVLIVDDSQMARKMLRRTLERRSYKCDEAEDGRQAIALVTRAIDSGTKYDVILMDYQMPIMNGPDATRRILELGFTGVIYGVTGNVVQSELNTFLSSGAKIIFPKPLEVRDLEDALERLRQ